MNKHDDQYQGMNNYCFLSLLFICLGVWSCTATYAYAEQDIPIGDVANGTLLYQQRCALCHGLTGLGDGEMSAQAIKPPTPLGDPDYMRSAIPNNMLNVIVNGRINNGMPPFGEGNSNPLTEQEQWDVIAYLYALGISRDNVLAGKAAVTESDQAIIDSIDWANSNHQTIELPNNVVVFGRMAQFRYLLGAGQVAGTVVNQSTGMAMSDMAVTLRAFEGFRLVDEWGLTSDENGAFVFDLPDVTADLIYQTQVVYEDVPYSSDFIRFNSRQMSQSGSLTVFDVTTDQEDVLLVQQRTVIDMSPEHMMIDQLYSFRYDGNDAYIGGLTLVVPDEATAVSINDVRSGQLIPNVTVVEVEDGVWQDEKPLLPANNVRDIVVRYQLPRVDTIQLAHQLIWPTDNILVIAPDGITLNEEWSEIARREINGRTMIDYAGTADEQLSITLSGLPATVFDQNTGQQLLVRNEQKEFWIGFLSLLLTMTLGIVLVNRWRKQIPADTQPLLQEIISLDEAYSIGDIQNQLYEDRRKAIMQKLRDNW